MLKAQGRLPKSIRFVGISWLGGGEWEVREPSFGGREWEPCSDPFEIANKQFKPDALKRAF